jgi:putative aldouronate transport system permease protein
MGILAKAVSKGRPSDEKKRRHSSTFHREGVIWLWVMMIPATVMMLIFAYAPMFGVVIAFMDYNPLLGFRSQWVGLLNFEILFSLPDVYELLRNTIFIAVGKIVFSQIASILFALLLNELTERFFAFKRAIQTFVYLPHFISWVIIGGIMMDVMSSGGIVNQGLRAVGVGSPPGWLSDPKVFPWTLILSEVWKSFGWGAIIYLAAITGIGQETYESASVDGANRFHKMWYITLPGMAPMIMLNMILSVGSILNAGLDQILFLYNPAVYSTGDVLDTYVYRVGIQSASWSFGQAVSLIKSIIGFVLVLISWTLANKYSGWKPF